MEKRSGLTKSLNFLISDAKMRSLWRWRSWVYRWGNYVSYVWHAVYHATDRGRLGSNNATSLSYSNCWSFSNSNGYNGSGGTVADAPMETEWSFPIDLLRAGSRCSGQTLASQGLCKNVCTVVDSLFEGEATYVTLETWHIFCLFLFSRNFVRRLNQVKKWRFSKQYLYHIFFLRHIYIDAFMSCISSFKA